MLDGSPAFDLIFGGGKEDFDPDVRPDKRPDSGHGGTSVPLTAEGPGAWAISIKPISSSDPPRR